MNDNIVKLDGEIGINSLQEIKNFINTNREKINDFITKERDFLIYLDDRKHKLEAELDRVMKARAAVIARNYKLDNADVFDNMLQGAPLDIVLPNNDIQRTATFTTNLIPNPHLDKETLSPTELTELLLWGAELAGTKLTPEKIVEIHKTVVPAHNTLPVKIIDLISNALYGNNNYIGPYKTGMAVNDMTIEDIVRTIPVLSQSDAEARLHDIILEVDQGPKVDNVLRGTMRAAQVFRPLMHRGVGNFDLLKLAGDVEKNPGPKEWTLENKSMVDEIKKIIENPGDTVSYLTEVNNNTTVDWMLYTMRNHNVILRSAFDNGSQRALAGTNWIQLAGVFANDVGANVFEGDGRRFSSWVIEPRTYKILPRAGKLGAGLDQALQAFQDFLAAERTANNIVSGDNLLGIWQRVSNVDYGMYLPLLKLFLYGHLAYSAFGDWTTGLRADAEVSLRVDNVAFTGIASHIYPLSENRGTGAGQINATWITQSEYVQVLRGTLNLGYDLNNVQVAVIPYARGVSAAGIALLILTKLEWPFTRSDLQQTVDIDAFSAGNGVPTRTTPINMTAARISENTRIDGGLNQVVFVKMDDFNDNIAIFTPTVGAGQITHWPVNFDVQPHLIDYVELSCNQTLGPIPAWAEILDYWSKCASVEDWQMAVMCAANVIQRKRNFMAYGQNLGAANAHGPWLNAGAQPAYFDASIHTETLTNANALAIRDSAFVRPTFTAIGMPDYYYGALPAAGTRVIIPVTCKIQDSPPLCYYAVMMRMLAKDVIQGKKISDIPKANPKKLWYVIFETSERLLQMTHHWFQNNRIDNRLLFDAGAQVTNMRLQTFAKLNSVWCAWQMGFTGTCFMRFAPPILQNLAAFAAAPYYDNEAFLNSMVCLHNDILDGEMEKGVFPVVPMPQMKLSALAPKWGPYPTAAININGTNILGANAVISPECDVISKEGTFSLSYDMFYALTHCMHMINPGCAQRLLDVNTVLKDSRGLILVRPLMCFFNKFLQWTSASSTSDDFRIGVPTTMGMFIPHFLPEIDVQSGQQLLIAVGNALSIQNVRNFISVDGTGSSNFTYTTASAANIIGRMALPPGDHFF